MNGRKITDLVAWGHARRKTINAWVIRGVSFYFGYRILDHEIYGKETAEPLLIFLGLWLCGIAPASFFDGIRKVGATATTTPGADDVEAAKTELKSERRTDTKGKG